MAEPAGLKDPIYDAGDGRRLSLQDLLDVFAKRGVMRASDLHLKVGCPPVYRIDGDLQASRTAVLDSATVEAAVLRLLPEEDFERLRDRKAVDGSLMQDNLQFRLNVFYDSDGLAVAIRALEAGAPDVETLGFPNQVWRDIVNRQQGLVLMTGITGCGKSTTIASLITRIAQTHPCRIITLEDPVEYRLRSEKAVVSQRELGRDVPSFRAGPARLPARGPGCHLRGRDARPRGHHLDVDGRRDRAPGLLDPAHARCARLDHAHPRHVSARPAGRGGQPTLDGPGVRHLAEARAAGRRQGPRGLPWRSCRTPTPWPTSSACARSSRFTRCMQTQTKDTAAERMVTLERSLAELVSAGIVAPLEAEKWANHPATFIDEMKWLQEGIS